MICTEKEKKRDMFKTPPNKPLQQHYWNLEISICTGFITNIDLDSSVDNSLWINRGDDVQYQAHIGDIDLSHKGIKLQILLDDLIIYSSDLEKIDTHELSLDILASSEEHRHKLVFEITGYCADLHMPLLPDQTEARPGIRVDSLKFENVDITRAFGTSSVFVFENTQSRGDTVFGCNGTSTFEFSSPIYRWLINNKHTIARL